MSLPKIKTLLLTIAALAATRRPRRGPVGRLDADREDALQGRPLRAASSWTARGCSAARQPPSSGLAGSARRATAGWTRGRVPNAWNAGDDSDASFARRRRLVPQGLPLPEQHASALAGSVRFESVNYRAQVWLNGKPIGTNSGAYLPFEFRLPTACSSAAASTASSMRVDSRRLPTDFPPVGPVDDRRADRRLVELRRHPARGLPARDRRRSTSTPSRAARTCRARPAPRRVQLQGRRCATHGGAPARARHRARFGARGSTLGTRRGRAEAVRDVHDARIAVAQPAPLVAGPPVPLRRRRCGAVGRQTRSQRYTLRTGIRSIKVADGRLFLNGRPLNFRGVGAPRGLAGKGFAIDNADRDQQIALGQGARRDVIRTPLPAAPVHPGARRRARDHAVVRDPGLPVKTRVPQADARARSSRPRELRDEHQRQQQPPVGDRLVDRQRAQRAARPGPGRLHPARGRRRAKALDPTRPVGLRGRRLPDGGCQPRYAPLDVLGVNDYFGWYPGPSGQIADRTLLSDYLDRVHACYPNKAIVVTEFGAEANRDGPVEEKGTYAFQQDFVNYHLGVYATEAVAVGRDLLGAAEFRVRPGLGRRQPAARRRRSTRRASITFDGVKKPAFADVQRIYKATQQIGPPPATAARSRGRAGGRPRRASLPSSAAHGTSHEALTSRRARPPLPRHAPPAPRGPRARRRLRRRRATPSPSRSTRASCATRSPPAAPCSNSRSAATRPRPSSRTPSATRARRHAARRLPARPPRRRDPRDRRARAHRRRGGARRHRGRRARAGHARAEHRGAPERDPRVDPARRLRAGDRRHGDARRPSPRRRASRCSTTSRRPSSPRSPRRALDVDAEEEAIEDGDRARRRGRGERRGRGRGRRRGRRPATPTATSAE